jgi:hypothetical protein
MANYEMKDGDISLYENDKQGNEKRPDLTGKLKINGIMYKISVWERNAGKLKFSGQVEEYKYQSPDKTNPEPKKEEPFSPNPVDDGLPF